MVSNLRLFRSVINKYIADSKKSGSREVIAIGRILYLFYDKFAYSVQLPLHARKSLLTDSKRSDHAFISRCTNDDTRRRKIRTKRRSMMTTQSFQTVSTVTWARKCSWSSFTFLSTHVRVEIDLSAQQKYFFEKLCWFTWALWG